MKIFARPFLSLSILLNFPFGFALDSHAIERRRDSSPGQPEYVAITINDPDAIGSPRAEAKEENLLVHEPVREPSCKDEEKQDHVLVEIVVDPIARIGLPLAAGLAEPAANRLENETKRNGPALNSNDFLAGLDLVTIDPALLGYDSSRSLLIPSSELAYYGRDLKTFQEMVNEAVARRLPLPGVFSSVNGRKSMEVIENQSPVRPWRLWSNRVSYMEKVGWHMLKGSVVVTGIAALSLATGAYFVTGEFTIGDWPLTWMLVGFDSLLCFGAGGFYAVGKVETLLDRLKITRDQTALFNQQGWNIYSRFDRIGFRVPHQIIDLTKIQVRWSELGAPQKVRIFEKISKHFGHDFLSIFGPGIEFAVPANQAVRLLGDSKKDDSNRDSKEPKICEVSQVKSLQGMALEALLENFSEIPVPAPADPNPPNSNDKGDSKAVDLVLPTPSVLGARLM